MALSSEMRRLETKWVTGSSWPKFLEWLELKEFGVGTGSASFAFPIVAIVGENGSGKSTILQAAAHRAYQSEEGDPAGTTWFPSEFFPETAWDELRDVRIRFGLQTGSKPRRRLYP